MLLKQLSPRCEYSPNPQKLKHNHQINFASTSRGRVNKIRIAALNDSFSGDSSGSGPPVKSQATKEAKEAEAFALYNKALSHLRHGESDKAEAVFKDLTHHAFLEEAADFLEEDPDDAKHPGLPLLYSIHKNMAALAMQRGNDHAAMESYLEAIKIDTSEVTVWYKIGKLAIKIQNYQLAKLGFEQGLECNPCHWPCLDNLITILYALNNYWYCLYYIGKAFEMDPGYCKGLAFRDQIFSEQPSLERDTTDLFESCDQLALHAKPDKEEATEFIEEALAIRVKRRELGKPPPPPIIKIPNKLEKYTWKCLGEGLIALYDKATTSETRMSLCLRVDLSEYADDINKVTSKEEKLEPSVAMETKSDGQGLQSGEEKMDVTAGQDSLASQDTKPVDADIDKPVSQLNASALAKPEVVTEREANTCTSKQAEVDNSKVDKQNGFSENKMDISEKLVQPGSENTKTNQLSRSETDAKDTGNSPHPEKSVSVGVGMFGGGSPLPDNTRPSLVHSQLGLPADARPGTTHSQSSTDVPNLVRSGSGPFEVQTEPLPLIHRDKPPTPIAIPDIPNLPNPPMEPTPYSPFASPRRLSLSPSLPKIDIGLASTDPTLHGLISPRTAPGHPHLYSHHLPYSHSHVPSHPLFSPPISAPLPPTSTLLNPSLSLLYSQSQGDMGSNMLSLSRMSSSMPDMSRSLPGSPFLGPGLTSSPQSHFPYIGSGLTSPPHSHTLGLPVPFPHSMTSGTGKFLMPPVSVGYSGSQNSSVNMSPVSSMNTSLSSSAPQSPAVSAVNSQLLQELMRQNSHDGGGDKGPSQRVQVQEKPLSPRAQGSSPRLHLQKELDDKSPGGKRGQKRKRGVLTIEDTIPGKRRSARVRNTGRKKEEDVINFHELLQAFLPSSLKMRQAITGLSLTSRQVQDIENTDTDTGGEEMDVDIAKPAQSGAGTRPSDEVAEDWKEEDDVKEFLMKFQQNSGTISLMNEYLVHLAERDKYKWPAGLCDIYLEIYSRVRKHLSMPDVLCRGDMESDEWILECGKMCLVWGELQLDKWMALRSKYPTSPSKSPKSQSPNLGVLQEDDLPKNYKNDIWFITSLVAFSDILQDHWLQHCIRVFWMKAKFYNLQARMEDALYCYHKAIEYLEYGKEEGVTRVTLPNCTMDNVITLEAVKNQQESLQRCQSLEETQRLYDAGDYQKVVDSLLQAFGESQAKNKGVGVPVVLPERQSQLVLLQDSLFHLKDFGKCLYWGEECFNESYQQYKKARDDAGKLECTNSMIEMFGRVQRAIDKDSSSIRSLPSNKLVRLAQNLVTVVDICMSVPESALEMPIDTVLPWILLYQLIKHEEDKIQAMQLKSAGSAHGSSRDDLYNVMPSSLMLLNIAHEYLGSRCWCTKSDGALLLFIMDVLKDKMANLSNYQEELYQAFEQAVYCLFGHPNKRGKAKHLQDHNAPQITLKWEHCEAVFDYFKPKNVPEFDSYKSDAISSEVESLLKRIVPLVPENKKFGVPQEAISNYIEGNSDTAPTVAADREVKLPVVKELYYLLADYHFKNKEPAKAIKFYVHDLCMVPNRLDSWAGMALARMSQLEQKLSTAELKMDVPVYKKSIAALRCFKRAVELDSSNGKLWIEYGSLAYQLHSHASRQIKWNKWLPLDEELLHIAQDSRSEMLQIAYNCYKKASECEGDGVEEEWLHHYMMGKCLEKMKRHPREYMEHYKKASCYLHEDNAIYPKKITYAYTTPRLAVEALEMFYRLHVVVLKQLRKEVSEETIDKYRLFIKYTREAFQSPFAQGVEKKHDKRGRHPSASTSQDESSCSESNMSFGTSGKSKLCRVPSSDHTYVKQKSNSSNTSMSSAEGVPTIAQSSSTETVLSTGVTMVTTHELHSEQVDMEVANEKDSQQVTLTTTVEKKMVGKTDSNIDLPKLATLGSSDIPSSQITPAKAPPIKKMETSPFSIASILGPSFEEKGKEAENKIGTVEQASILKGDYSDISEESATHGALSDGSASIDSAFEDSASQDSASQNSAKLPEPVSQDSASQNSAKFPENVPEVHEKKKTDDTRESQLNVGQEEKTFNNGPGKCVDDTKTTGSKIGEELLSAQTEMETEPSLTADSCPTEESEVVRKDCAGIEKKTEKVVEPAGVAMVGDKPTDLLDISAEKVHDEPSIVPMESEVLRNKVEELVEQTENVTGKSETVNGKSEEGKPESVSDRTDADLSQTAVSTTEAEGKVRDADEAEKHPGKSEPMETDQDDTKKSQVKEVPKTEVAEAESETKSGVDAKEKEPDGETRTQEKAEPEVLLSKEEMEKELYEKCKAAFELCLSRFPTHYKSHYRLAYLYMYSPYHKNLQSACDMLLGTQQWQQQKHLVAPGLFLDRKLNNFFNNIWKIPIDEIDRSGSFPSHLNRSVLLLLKVLAEMKDSSTLLQIHRQLIRSPDAGKKYLRDPERVYLAKLAYKYCLDALQGEIQDLASEKDESKLCKFIVSVYKIWEHGAQKQMYKEKGNKTLLEAFRLLRKGEFTPLEAVIRFCKQQIELARIIKQQQAQAEGKRLSSVSDVGSDREGSQSVFSPVRKVVSTHSSATTATQPTVNQSPQAHALSAANQVKSVNQSSSLLPGQQAVKLTPPRSYSASEPERNDYSPPHMTIQVTPKENVPKKSENLKALDARDYSPPKLVSQVFPPSRLVPASGVGQKSEMFGKSHSGADDIQKGRNMDSKETPSGTSTQNADKEKSLINSVKEEQKSQQFVSKALDLGTTKSPASEKVSERSSGDISVIVLSDSSDAPGSESPRKAHFAEPVSPVKKAVERAVISDVKLKEKSLSEPPEKDNDSQDDVFGSSVSESLDSQTSVSDGEMSLEETGASLSESQSLSSNPVKRESIPPKSALLQSQGKEQEQNNREGRQQTATRKQETSSESESSDDSDDEKPSATTSSESENESTAAEEKVILIDDSSEDEVDGDEYQGLKKEASGQEVKVKEVVYSKVDDEDEEEFDDIPSTTSESEVDDEYDPNKDSESSDEYFEPTGAKRSRKRSGSVGVPQKMGYVHQNVTNVRPDLVNLQQNLTSVQPGIVSVRPSVSNLRPNIPMLQSPVRNVRPHVPSMPSNILGIPLNIAAMTAEPHIVSIQPNLANIQRARQAGDCPDFLMEIEDSD